MTWLFILFFAKTYIFLFSALFGCDISALVFCTRLLALADIFFYISSAFSFFVRSLAFYFHNFWFIFRLSALLLPLVNGMLTKTMKKAAAVALRTIFWYVSVCIRANQHTANSKRKLRKISSFYIFISISELNEFFAEKCSKIIGMDSDSYSHARVTHRQFLHFR